MGVDDGRIDLSLYESHLGEEASDITNPEITSIGDLKVGMTHKHMHQQPQGQHDCERLCKV